VNGFANWDREYGEFYIEETGIVADALQEALVQDYDGVIRIAPAIPPGWDFAGSVFVRCNTRVDVEVRGGEVVTAVIEAGTTARLQVRNPWPGQAVDVIAGGDNKIAGNGNKPVRHSDSGQLIRFDAVAGTSYLFQKHAPPVSALRFCSGEWHRRRGAEKAGIRRTRDPPRFGAMMTVKMQSGSAPADHDEPTKLRGGLDPSTRA
jgi:hypothetical protein